MWEARPPNVNNGIIVLDMAHEIEETSIRYLIYAIRLIFSFI